MVPELLEAPGLVALTELFLAATVTDAWGLWWHTFVCASLGTCGCLAKVLSHFPFAKKEMSSQLPHPIPEYIICVLGGIQGVACLNQHFPPLTT